MVRAAAAMNHHSASSPFATFNVVFMSVLVVLIIADCIYLKVSADKMKSNAYHGVHNNVSRAREGKEGAAANANANANAANANKEPSPSSVAVAVVTPDDGNGASGPPIAPTIPTNTRAYYDEARQKDPWFGRVYWAKPQTPTDRPTALSGSTDVDADADANACSASVVEVRDTGNKEADARARTLLCTVYKRSAILLDYLKSQLDNGMVVDFPKGSGRDISLAAKRLIDRHRGRLVLREYYNPDPDDMVVALNVNKGEELAVCVRNKQDVMELNCVNTMMRVVLHEFAHTMDEHYRMNAKHGPCFDRLADFLYLLGEGIDVEVPGGGLEPLYHCPYSCDGEDGPLKSHVPFCGLSLPRSHCPSDADPSPTAVACDTEEESSPTATGTGCVLM
jgi:hypothetical protein